MKALAALLPVVVLATQAAPLFAEEVISEGVALIGAGGSPLARDVALEDAKRRAVEMIAGTLLESDTLTRNAQLLRDEIRNTSRGLIEEFTVISEEESGGVLRVRIAATVRPTEVRSALEDLGLLSRLLDLPRVGIVVDTLGKTGISVVEEVFLRELRRLQFNCVDPAAVRRSMERHANLLTIDGESDAARVVGELLGVDLLIMVRSQLETTEVPYSPEGSSLRSAIAVIGAKAIAVDTGAVLAAAEANAKAIGVGEGGASTAAAKEATEDIVLDLAEQVSKAWHGRETQGSSFLVVVTGLSDHRTLREIEGVLRSETRGVRGLIRRSFSRGVALLQIEFDLGSSSVFFDLLESSLARRGLGAELMDLSSGRMEIRIEPRNHEPRD